MSSDPGNSTHYGELKLQTFVDMATLRTYIDIFSQREKLFSYTIDMCNLQNAQSNWIIKGYIEYFSKIYDFGIFKCPFKSGIYIFRPISQSQTISLDLPSVFPVNKSGDVKTTLKGRRVGGKKAEMVYETSESYMLREGWWDHRNVKNLQIIWNSSLKFIKIKSLIEASSNYIFIDSKHQSTLTVDYRIRFTERENRKYFFIISFLSKMLSKALRILTLLWSIHELKSQNMFEVCSTEFNSTIKNYK